MFNHLTLPPELKPSDPRFGPGPSLIPVSFVQSLLDSKHNLLGTSHRQKGVKGLVHEIQEGLRSYFELPTDYEVVLGNGGATFLFDMIGLGAVEKKSSHFVCGEFSAKWAKSHDIIPSLETYVEKVDFGEGIDPSHQEGCDLLCCTLNETSTGVIIDRFPKAQSGQLISVDGTSGGGQVPCDLSKVDLFFFSPQKVFASDGGLWVAIMSPQAIERVLRLEENKVRYRPAIMSWKTAIENSRKSQTYNTPAVATLFFLNEQVKKLNESGYQSVCDQGFEKAKIVYDWAEQKPYLSCFVKEARFRSNTVATIDVSDQVSATDLTQKLRSENYAWDIDSYRKLGRNQLRIALFHNVQKEDLEKLCQSISWAIESVL